MPRAKRIRLWRRPEKRKADGYVREATWIIIDGNRHISTGCATGETERAQRALAAYIGAKYQPARRARSIEDILIADVLAVYHSDVGPKQTPPKKFNACVERLNEFWGAKTLVEVSKATCKEFGDKRGTVAGARRDLEILRAAINHHAGENLHREIVNVTLPPKGRSRERWLTRDEAAKLLWVCWRTPEIQNGKPTDKRPLRHLARLILIGIYTGTRFGAIAAASPKRGEGRSWVDLRSGVFHRLKIGAAKTNKRQPPVRLPDRLLAHLRRWARLEPDLEHFVTWAGRPVKSVKTGLTRAAQLAGVGHVHPHVFRHTAATWLMQAGVPIWEASGFVGMSEKTLRDVYGHHHSDFQHDAADAIGYRRRPPRGKVIAL
jgi:integrase